MKQEEVLGRALDALNALGAPHMIVGSFASNVHGVPRMTQDADVVVDLDEPLAVRLVRLLEGDFYVSEEAAREAVRSRRMFNAIHFETAFKIDLMVKKARPFSAEELSRRQPGILAGREVDYASAEDTILTKLEWALLGASERQYHDAVGILDIHRERLDWAYMERWGPELGVSELLARARSGAPFEP